jgi:DNA-binding NarL/FixJ family response regulator
VGRDEELASLEGGPAAVVQAAHAVATELGALPLRLELTPRELEVLALLADGLTNREIGGELFISEKTASVHVSRILSKLSVPNRAAAAAAAQRLGISA